MNKSRQEYISYIKYAVKGLSNKTIRESVLAGRTDDSCYLLHKGDKNPYDNYLYIKADAPYSGWFSIMNLVISGLLYAYKFNLKPYVEMAHSNFYSDPDSQCANLFEQYYKQPSDITAEDFDILGNVAYISNDRLSYAAEHRTYDQDSLCVNKLAKAVNKYVVLNDVTDSYVKNGIDSVINGKRILGVHVRGTDFKAGFNGHGQYITTEEYIDKTKELYKSGKYDGIFLATDEDNTIKMFEKEFGGIVSYYDVFRASADSEIGLHYTREERPHHKYMLGLEVIRDMYTLASCEGLIGTVSGIPYHAIIQKRAEKKKYSDIVILNNGINHNDKDSIKTIKDIAIRTGI